MGTAIIAYVIIAIATSCISELNLKLKEQYKTVSVCEIIRMELSAVRTRRSREVTGHTPHSVAIVSLVGIAIVHCRDYIISRQQNDHETLHCIACKAIYKPSKGAPDSGETEAGRAARGGQCHHQLQQAVRSEGT